MTCVKYTSMTLPIRAIDNMEITLRDARSHQSDSHGIVRQHIQRLSPRELEVCLLHFVEGRCQLLIAEWLGLKPRTVRLYLKQAVEKAPSLKKLCVKSRLKPPRPKLFHLSQLRPTERGPFNADEV